MPQTRTITLGSVAVDSGTLLIIDPCYVDDYWISQDQAQIFDLKIWGADCATALAAIPLAPDTEITANASRTVFHIHHPSWTNTQYTTLQETIQHKAASEQRQIHTECREGSTLQEIYAATDGPNQGGTLPAPRFQPPDASQGPAFPTPYIGGPLVGFQTGFGDGLYEVKATLVDLGPRRKECIARITIDFIDLDSLPSE